MIESDDIMLTDILEDLEEIKLEFERKEVKNDMLLMIRGVMYGTLIMVLILTIFVYIPRAFIEGF